MPTLEALGIDRMTVGERIALVQDILDSVAADQPRPPVSEAKKAELARRIADANLDDVVPWDEIKADALARSVSRLPDAAGVIGPPSGLGHGGIDYTKILTVEPDKRSGQPCIRGIRMTVLDVLEYLGGGMTVDEVLEDFPDLTREDIQACLAYAADTMRRARDSGRR